jgi:hypothetical protein
MNDWTTRLKPLDLEGLDAIDLDDLQQPWDAVYAATTYGEAIADLDASVRVKTPVNHCRDATAIKSMTEAIGTLPAVDESIHLWIGGQHSMGHVIPAVLELAAPAQIETVHVATLTFSKDNASEWASLIDSGRIKSMFVLCSQYFQKTSTGIYDFAIGIFAGRPIEVFPRRAHAKLLAMKLTNGQTVTAEGSSNTRSARTIEQVALFGNPEVYAFHVRQMERAKNWTKDRGGQ